MPFTVCQLAFYNSTMKSTVFLDKAGRVVIPKPLRDELRLSPGDGLHLDFEGGAVTLRPASSASHLMKERGVWIFRRGAKLTAAQTNQTLRDIRAKRDLSASRRSR